MKTLKWSAGDLYFSADGKPKFVEQDEKVAQDIAYYVLEELSTNKPKSRNEVQLSVFNAIGKMRSIQNGRSDLSPREKVSEISEFDIVPNPTSPQTEFYFFFIVTTEAGDRVPKLFDPSERTDLSHLLPEEGV